MNDKPLVSVIAACYNQACYAIETLESIRNQTYKNIELIIWDDASTDNSVEVIEDWIQKHDIPCVFLKHTENLGICKSLNDAFTHVNGKYLQMTAVDDILLPEKIERQVDILENSGLDDALVFSDAFLINEKSELHQNKFIAYHKHYLNIKSGYFFDELLRGNFIPCMTILYKVEVLKEIGRWDENLRYEDYDMLLRIAYKYKFIYTNEMTVKYRLHADNLHKKLINYSNFSIFLKYVDNDIANNWCKHELMEMYHSHHKDLYLKFSQYSQKKKASGLLFYCIKYKLPYRLYLIMQSFFVK